MNSLPVLVTGDGSHTVVHSSGKETYHSRHGAIQESRHVFIHHGLAFTAEHHSDIAILEVGFGTGLNAFLTYLFAIENPHLSILYTGIEKFPIGPSLSRQLNYVEQLRAESHRSVFERMHEDNTFQIENFCFNLFEGDILDFPEHLTWQVSKNLQGFHDTTQGLRIAENKTMEVSKDLQGFEATENKNSLVSQNLQGLNSDDDKTLEVSKNLQGLRENTHRLNDILYNVVYFDAFAPNFQPEMWSAEIFQSLKEKMSPDAILVTYCAQGQFQRTLKSLGFQVEILPGPPGKREMVRAAMSE